MEKKEIRLIKYQVCIKNFADPLPLAQSFLSTVRKNTDFAISKRKKLHLLYVSY